MMEFGNYPSSNHLFSSIPDHTFDSTIKDSSLTFQSQLEVRAEISPEFRIRYLHLEYFSIEKTLNQLYLI